jgi:hypothetical protein
MHMSAKVWLALLVLVALVALFVPFVPQTQASAHFVTANFQRTADVSPSYYLFHCGAYMNAQLTAQLGGGYTGFYQLSKGYSFQCNYNYQ